MEKNTSATVTNGDTVPRIIGFAAAGCGAGIAAEQNKLIFTYVPKESHVYWAAAEDRAEALGRLLTRLPRGSTLAVSTLAILGPEPEELQTSMDLITEQDLILIIADIPVKIQPSQGGGAVALLQAAAALGAAAVERAAEAARPSLPPAPDGRGRPRSLDAADVQKIAEAPAATSAAALAAELAVSRRTVQRYRARLREEA